MDLGNATFTEFKMNEDVAAYMAQNIELFDCEIGLVHSHHQMSTNPSGTDLNTLREEGNERNCFVSLIVNNAGTYYAAITRKVQSKSEVTVKSLGTSYEFFGEGSKTLINDGTELTKTVDKEYIEYFDLQIERHEFPNTLSYLDTRFEEIENKKKDTPKTHSVYYPQTYTNQSKSETNDVQFFDWLHPTKIRNDSEQQTSLDFKDTQKQDSSEMETAYNWTPDPKKIYESVVHIVTLNLILNPKDFNFDHWITRHMSNVYKKFLVRHMLKELLQLPLMNGVISSYSSLSTTMMNLMFLLICMMSTTYLQVLLLNLSLMSCINMSTPIPTYSSI